MNYITLALKYWKIIALVASLIALTAIYTFIYTKGFNDCEAEIITKTITKTITVKEKQDEIRNNKPTISRVANRLRANTF